MNIFQLTAQYAVLNYVLITLLDKLSINKEKEKVGQPNVSFVLMRKSTGNTALPPAATFGSLEPILETNERFKLDACAQVG